MKSPSNLILLNDGPATIEKLWKPEWTVVAKAIGTWRSQWDKQVKGRL